MHSRRDILRGSLAGLSLLGGANAKAPGGEDGPERLARAYPECVRHADRRGVVFRDGGMLPWSDGEADKTFEQKLASASIADQMSLTYRRGPLALPPRYNDDPGRFRNIAFFKKMYGADEAAVRANLDDVPWRIGDYAGALPFTHVNGVSIVVEKIVRELGRLSHDMTRFLVPPAGSFNWRPIAGTCGLSPHAFGIAVDINAAPARYWRWNGTEQRRNVIPFEIVDIFERNGFIWGGKWYHYDTMHFEYRPELLG